MDAFLTLEMLFGGLLVASLHMIWLMRVRIRRLNAHIDVLEEENDEAFRLLRRTQHLWLARPK